MFQPTPHGVFEENPSELTWRNWPPQLKRHSKHWLHMVREKNEGTSKFHKNRNHSLPVPSAKPFLRNIRWTTGQHIVIIWGCPVSCGLRPDFGSCVSMTWIRGMDHSIIIQGMDPGGPRPWSIAFSPPSCKPSYRMLQRHEIVIRSHIFLSFPRFLAIPWPLGPPTGGQLAHGIVQLRFIKADLQKKQAGQLGRL